MLNFEPSYRSDSSNVYVMANGTFQLGSGHRGQIFQHLGEYGDKESCADSAIKKAVLFREWTTEKKLRESAYLLLFF